MSTNSLPSDKYAFLFSGPTLDRFMKDIEHVFATLTGPYGYPAAHIAVVLGGTPAAMPSVPGATVTVLGVNKTAGLQSALTTFRLAASGANRTALLYFTGGGVSQAGVTKLVIDNTPAGTTTIDPAWLTSRLNGFGSTAVQVVMQQACAGGFSSVLAGLALPAGWSFTAACSSTEDSYGDNTAGSFFTSCWNDGLRLATLTAVPGSPDPDDGKYADQLGSAGESTDLCISLQEAEEFAKKQHDRLALGPAFTSGCTVSAGPQYLGLPAFLLRDGTSPVAWYESPDIFLTHPNHPWVPAGDLYITDLPGATAPYNNTVNVQVHNTGTHPVRRFGLGISSFGSPYGTSIGTVTKDWDLISDPDQHPGPLLPGGIVTYLWNTAMYLGMTHGCIQAQARPHFSDVDLDFSTVSVADNDEAQRNTDPMPIVPPPPSPPPHLKNLQGFSEHVYHIRNPFKNQRKFMLAMPEEVRRYADVLRLEWFRVTGGQRGERVPLGVIPAPVPHIPFTLKAGEVQDIILRVTMEPGFSVKKGVRLPFELLAEGTWPEGTRRTAVSELLANYAPLAGITAVIERKGLAVTGTVIGRDKKPVPGAKVFLATASTLHGAFLTSDKKGVFASDKINPGVYTVRAGAGGMVSEDTVLVLHDKMPDKPLVLQLDEERQRTYFIRFAPIGDHEQKDPFRISAETDLPEGSEVLMVINPAGKESARKTRPAMTSVLRVQKGRLVLAIGADELPPMEYTIDADSLEEDAAASAKFAVLKSPALLTITAAGDQSYYPGEDITFSGMNTMSKTTYLVLVGPNLKPGGCRPDTPDPANSPVVDNDPSTFTQVPVKAGGAWSFAWHTKGVKLDAGTYTVYALSAPKKPGPGNALCATVSVIIKKPWLSVSAQKQPFPYSGSWTITGIATGRPTPGVAVWFIAGLKTTVVNVPVRPDDSFSYTFDPAALGLPVPGQYMVIVQHPMTDDRFDIVQKGQDIWNLKLGTSGKKVLALGDLAKLQGSDAAEAIVSLFSDPQVDDRYVRLQLLLEAPYIRLDAIPGQPAGRKLTVMGTTNLAEKEEVIFEFYSSDFKPTQKSQKGEFSGATATSRVIPGTATANRVSLDIDASVLKPGPYIITATSVKYPAATAAGTFSITP